MNVNVKNAVRVVLLGSLGCMGLVSASVQAEEVAPAAHRLSLRAFAALVSESDETVRVQRLEQAVGNESIRSAKALFEPFVFTSLEREGMHVLNSAADAKQRGVNPGDVYDALETRFKSGVMVKAANGADMELSYTASQVSNSLQPLANAPSPENKGYLGLKLTMPLMRGAGVAVNQLGTDIAQADRKVIGESVRQQLAQRVMDGVYQYLLVQRAEERTRLRTRLHTVAAELEKEITSQHAAGLRSATELTEARASLALRRVQLAQAQQELEEQTNALQIFISARERLDNAPLRHTLVMPEPLENLDWQEAVPVPSTSPEALQQVMSRRPETRITALRVDREARRVEAAFDQARPEFNFTVRYGKEDLSSGYRAPSQYLGSSVPYNSWSVGLTYKVGLYGDEKRDSEYQTALIRRRQAELAVGAIQQRVVNEVRSSQAVLERSRQQLGRQREIVQAQRELLGIEKNLTREGRKSAIDVMRKQQEVLTAEEALADAEAQTARSAYLAAQVDGRLLSLLGLE